MTEKKQSKLGQELNRMMLESGLSPLETMGMVMERGALNIGAHTFLDKPISGQPMVGEQSNDRVEYSKSRET